MAQELLFTSAPKGLKPGSSGPCIVLMTDSMPPLLMHRLEALSGYRLAHDGQPPLVSLSHVRIDMNGMRRHVVSRIADAGADHAGRANRLAHHLVLHGEELGLAGPAWLVQQPVFRSAWDGVPAYLEQEAWLPEGPPQPVHVCANWKTIAGDAGWAGVIAEHALSPSPRPVWIIHRRGVPVMALLDEVLSVVPTRERWKITFSTQFTQPMPGAECTVRFCLAGSDAAQAALHADGLLIDLAAPGRLDRSGGLVTVARTGRAASAAQPAASAAVAPVELEPERRGKRVVPMLDTKPPTRIDPAQRQASMPAIDVGVESVDQGPATQPAPRRAGAVPWLPWAVAVAVTVWAALVTVRLLQLEPAVPTAAPLAEITPVDGEREAMRRRVEELESTVKSAAQERAARDARLTELVESADRDRQTIEALEAELAARRAASGTSGPATDPGRARGSGEAESGAQDGGPGKSGARDGAAGKVADDARDGAAGKVADDARDGAAGKVADDARDALLARPQAASGAQRLGTAAGSMIELHWPDGAAVDIAWKGGAIVRRGDGTVLATLALSGGGVVWTWDALRLPSLSVDETEAVLDAATAATIRIDGAQAPVGITPRLLTLEVPRKSLVPKPVDLRTPLRLPWSGPITVQGPDGPSTVEPGKSIEVPVSDELGTRGFLGVALSARDARVAFSFTPDAALDRDAVRRRLAEATAASQDLALVREHDALVRQPPDKRRGSAASKARDAYDKYLARNLAIAEKIKLYRSQGLDDLKDQLERDSAAADAEFAAATDAVARGDALRARWPKAVVEIAPRGGQGFVIVRIEATGP